MSSENTKILGLNQYQSSDNAPFIIYADLECIIEKIDGCNNNLKVHLQQNKAKIFHQVFQCLQFLGLEA